MSSDDDARFAGDAHRVRPRGTWIGLSLMLIGSAISAVGIIWWTWPWIAVGVVVLLLGAGAAYRGGLFYDNDSSAGGVVEAVRKGGSFERPDPDTRQVDQAALEDAAATARQHHETMAAGPTSRPSLVPIGAILVLVVVLWLLVSQATMYPHTSDGRWGTVWAAGVAVVLGLGGINLIIRGRSSPTSIMCVLAGLAILLSGLLLDHGGLRSGVSEAASGIVALLGAALTFDRQARDHADTV